MLRVEYDTAERVKVECLRCNVEVIDAAEVVAVFVAEDNSVLFVVDFDELIFCTGIEIGFTELDSFARKSCILDVERNVDCRNCSGFAAVVEFDVRRSVSDAARVGVGQRSMVPGINCNRVACRIDKHHAICVFGFCKGIGLGSVVVQIVVRSEHIFRGLAERLVCGIALIFGFIYVFCNELAVDVVHEVVVVFAVREGSICAVHVKRIAQSHKVVCRNRRVVTVNAHGLEGNVKADFADYNVARNDFHYRRRCGRSS